MTLPIDVRRLAAAIAVAIALLVALLAPATADAYSAGNGGDHVWVKISRADVVGGATTVICRQYAGSYGWIVCPPLAATARQLVGPKGGVELRFYRGGRVTIARY